MKARAKSGKAGKPGSGKPQWPKIRSAYQRGEGSCRELAERFKVTPAAVEAHCKREKWRKARSESARKVSEKVVENLADEATEWVRRIKASCEKDLDLLDKARDRMARSPEPLALRQLAAARKSIDDVMRRALGLPDAPQKVEHDGGVMIEMVDPYAEPKGAK